MTDTLVSLVRCKSYGALDVEEAVAQLLKPWDGLAALVKPGQRVLIKPNLLAATTPDAAVTTHPALVSAIATMIARSGGHPFLGDSPAAGDISRLADITGIGDACRGTSTTILPFNRARMRDLCGHRQRRLPLAADLDEVDLIINVTKLKTHTLTGLTAAVKNCFGLVIGNAKRRLHLQHPLPLDFAHLLLDICLAAAPALHVVDAVIAMEGPGPRHGRPRHVGVLMASTNPVAVDSVAAAVVDFPVGRVATLSAAKQRGLPGSNLGAIRFSGPHPDRLRIAGFDRGPGGAGLPSILHRLPGAWVTQIAAARRPYPAVDPGRCSGCGACAIHCPPQIVRFGGDAPAIDPAHCIRCYCCLEVCPDGALTLGRKRQRVSPRPGE